MYNFNQNNTQTYVSTCIYWQAIQLNEKGTLIEKLCSLDASLVVTLKFKNLSTFKETIMKWIFFLKFTFSILLPSFHLLCFTKEIWYGIYQDYQTRVFINRVDRYFEHLHTQNWRWESKERVNKLCLHSFRIWLSSTINRLSNISTLGNLFPFVFGACIYIIAFKTFFSFLLKASFFHLKHSFFVASLFSNKI